MKIARYTDKNFAAKIRDLTTDASLFDAEIESRTKAILHEVYVRGDDAVLEFTERFDGAKLTAEQLAVTPAELFNASLKADESLRAAVAEAEKNVAFFSYEGRGIRVGNSPPRYEKIDRAIYDTSTIDNKVRDIISAVEPDSVSAMIARACMCRAVHVVDMAMASSMRSKCVSSRVSERSGGGMPVLSAPMQTRAIASTTFTGYFPAAVSAGRKRR